MFIALLLYMSWVSQCIYSSCDPDQRNSCYLGYAILTAEGRTFNKTMK